MSRHLNGDDKNALYVGDGAYVREELDGLLIFTSDGEFVTNEIYVEKQEIKCIVEYAKEHGIL